MPNGKTPEDTGEHLMALYGHVEGLKKDVNHLHRDIEKINHLENWEYNLLNESERIGSILKKRIIEGRL